ncbi:MAG TPA: hypothetical protein VFI96_01625 [Longimicrobiaceae bacterium]|nr:hypothetical protein [Longimicrobiaceae bacterium]
MIRVSLDRTQLRDLTVFPDAVRADRLIFEAVMHPPEGMSEEQRRFLRLSYERALRRAQGWEVR